MEIDFNHYAWRRPTTVGGEVRYLTPLNGEGGYWDLIFPNPDLAEAELDAWGLTGTAMDEKWVLMHYSASIVISSSFQGTKP
jgi:hypothetical protein